VGGHIGDGVSLLLLATLLLGRLPQLGNGLEEAAGTLALALARHTLLRLLLAELVEGVVLRLLGESIARLLELGLLGGGQRLELLGEDLLVLTLGVLEGDVVGLEVALVHGMGTTGNRTGVGGAEASGDGGTAEHGSFCFLSVQKEEKYASVVPTRILKNIELRLDSCSSVVSWSHHHHHSYFEHCSKQFTPDKRQVLNTKEHGEER
jgi:hypothetical protein